MKRRRLILSAALALALGLTAAFFLLTQAGRWRLAIIELKATGQLPQLGWLELASYLRPGSPVYLESLEEIHNPYAAIRNHLTGPEDVRAGAAIFRSNCAACHGGNGRGTANGPDLSGADFAMRNGDWTVYRTIRDGVPRTAMAGHPLSGRKIWQLVAFIRSLEQPATASVAHPAVASVDVPSARLLTAQQDTSGWYTYSGDYLSHRFSRLNQINAGNVARLQLAWQYQFMTRDALIETSPLVVNGVMFVTEPPGSALALDARTGAMLWRYSHNVPEDLRLCCGPVNRGLGVLDSLLYMGTLDAHLVALNARTGRVAWDVAVADYRDGYSITGAPLVIKDLVLTGVGGGEYGIRGFIDAYDAKTGRRRWRFYTVPAQGEPGFETWSGSSARTGGAPTWLTGSYDPRLNLVYWGTGNPSPNYQGNARSGDNLYSASVVALDADSGHLRWHFQFTPHDVHDWDAAQIPVLIDAQRRGTSGHLMAWANRNAFFYLLDRETGRFLLARPYARQTWAERIDSAGRPVPLPGGLPTPQGQLVFPGGGATNWWSPSFNPHTGLVYVPVFEAGSIFFQGAARFERGETFNGSATLDPPQQPCHTGVRAIDPLTAEVRWEHMFALRTDWCRDGGVLSTAGGLVFVGDHTMFFALDAQTGRELWRFNTGGIFSAAPVSYVLDGRQYVAVAAGRSLMVFALDGGTPRHN